MPPLSARPWDQGQIKEGQRGQLPRALPCKGAPRDDIYLFYTKYSFENLSWFKKDTRIQFYIPMLLWVSLMIFLQVSLSASFSNHYWI